MDYLTNFYKNKSEKLLEQIEILENKLKNIMEQSPPASVFVSGAKGQQAFSDEQLRDQMRANKRTNLFGPAIPDDKQSEAYRNAQAELNRRATAKTSNTASSAPAAPAAPARTQTQPSRTSAQSGSKQNSNIPYLLARDPSMPTPPAKGNPAPVSSAQRGVPVSRPQTQTQTQPSTYQGGPKSDFAAQQRAEMMKGMVQDTLSGGTKPDTSFNPSLFGGSQPKATTEPYDPLKSSADLAQKTANLLSTMGKPGKQASSPSLNGKALASNIAAGLNINYKQPTTGKNPSMPAATAQAGNNRPGVQATSNPLVSTFKATEFINKPNLNSNIGKIQLNPADLTDERRKAWSQEQLENEVGIIPTVRPPVTKPQVPGFWQNVGSNISFAKDVISNTGKGVVERIGDLISGRGNIIPDLSSNKDTQIAYGSSLMPKADKTASKVADWMDAYADSADGGLASDLLRGMAKTTRAQEATAINPKAAAAKAKYDQEMADMLKRGRK